METQRIAVLGAGSWGTALAKVLVENGHHVTLWSHRKEQADEINRLHLNKKYLGYVALPDTLRCDTSLQHAVKNADAIIVVVPTKAIRGVLSDLDQVIDGQPIIVHASKGIETETNKCISEIIAEMIDTSHRSGIGVLSGPSHAEELAVGDITTITAASEDESVAQYIQQIFTNHYFRIYTNTDIIGVEIGAALKNIIAIGAGALHGLGYGDDAKAAIITRGLAEISRFGVVIGANPLTFSGLSGVGDLIVTCTSPHSRNWRCGEQLGQGKSIDDILHHMGMVVEGVTTTKAAYHWAKQMHIDMPITTALYQVLYEDADVKQSIQEMMNRDLKSEIEF